MSRARPAAYGGRGWKPRRGTLASEIATGDAWSRLRVDSEFQPLEAVMIYRPGAELDGIRDPNAVQHLGRVDRRALAREQSRVAAAFRSQGVKVHDLAELCDGHGWPPKHNLLFVRDLFFPTPEGAVLARMASQVRAGEEKYAALGLARLGVPIAATISGRGTFEGADALWLDARTVVCGVGNRTNEEGFRQLAAVLARQGVRTERVPTTRKTQHLLGLLQLVDRRLALVRRSAAPAALVRLLERRGFRIVPVPESVEVVYAQGMNLVAVAPRKVLMPSGCPALRRQLESAGIRVAAELDLTQTLRGAGGLACATGILSRRPR